MNAVRSPEDIMPAIPPAGAAAPRVNPLQRIWLREIGMEKLWLKPAPAARQVDAQVVDLKGSVRPSGSGRTFGPGLAGRAARCSGAAGAGRAGPDAPARVAPAVRSGPPPKPVARQEPEVAEAPLIPVAERARNATLDELREQVVSCTACGLCQGRRHAVFGHGGQPARWLVVGEAPGEQEDRQGQPFVGRSGQLLDAMLSAVGMSRERDVFIANVIVPPARQPQPQARGNRRLQPLPDAPDRAAQARAHPGAGRFAAQTLLGTEATIGSLRGRVHQLKTDAGPQIPVIVSYHPPCCAARWKSPAPGKT